MQGALAVNVHVHDTYFIVGHFHYVMFGGTGFAFFAALLYWFPKMFGRMYSKKADLRRLVPALRRLQHALLHHAVLGCRACRGATTTTCPSTTSATWSRRSAPGSWSLGC